jgi:hypothetical protein
LPFPLDWLLNQVPLIAGTADGVVTEFVAGDDAPLGLAVTTSSKPVIRTASAVVTLAWVLAVFLNCIGIDLSSECVNHPG